jgi:SH3-like domain-containing protein
MPVERPGKKLHHARVKAKRGPDDLPISGTNPRQVLMAPELRNRALRLNLPALLVVLSTATATVCANAQTPPPDKLPRFASLRSDEVNLRVGPGENYPIEWVFKRKDMPVEVIEQFQNWRRVQDWQGDKGWVLDRMITAKRQVVVEGATRGLYKEPDPASPLVARAEPGVIARLIDLQGPWCDIQAGAYRGWVRRDEVWGVFADESLQ